MASKILNPWAAGMLVLLGFLGCTKSTTVSRDGGADAGGGSCEDGGKSYPIGASFKSSDGCNDCSCTAQGVVCTARACVTDGGGGAGLSWYRTCGAPVCGPGSDGPTGQAKCTSEQVGAVCTSKGKLCDPGLGCSVNLVCDSSDPTMGVGGCPISRARYKDDIHYLTEGEVSAVAEQLLATPLATFRYKSDAVGHDQVGFIIDDVEPSPSVDGDHVNLYGYTSMAVAALKVQAAQTQLLQRELLEMREHLLELEQRCR